MVLCIALVWLIVAWCMVQGLISACIIICTYQTFQTNQTYQTYWWSAPCITNVWSAHASPYVHTKHTKRTKSTQHTVNQTQELPNVPNVWSAHASPRIKWLAAASLSLGQSFHPKLFVAQGQTFLVLFFFCSKVISWNIHCPGTDLFLFCAKVFS